MCRSAAGLGPDSESGLESSPHRLQEDVDEAFPFEALQAAGYHAAVHGQKTYNGVAILSRVEPRDVERGFGDEGDDTQARLVSAQVGSFRVASAYVPNGAEVGSERWDYKLEWLRRLRAWLDRRFAQTDPLALCGDFNVAPEDRDVCDPVAWEGSVLTHPDARQALRDMRAWGLVDAFRLHHEQPGFFSWWDYRIHPTGAHRRHGVRRPRARADPSAPQAPRALPWLLA